MQHIQLRQKKYKDIASWHILQTVEQTNGVVRLYLEAKVQLIHFHKNKTA
jgi:hypothetical protein